MEIIKTALTDDSSPPEKLPEAVITCCSQVQELIINASNFCTSGDFETGRKLYLEAESIFAEKLSPSLPKGKMTRDERKKKLDIGAPLDSSMPPDRMHFYLNELLNQTHYRLSRLFLQEQLDKIVETKNAIKGGINSDGVDAEFHDLLKTRNDVGTTLHTLLPRAKIARSTQALSERFFMKIDNELTDLANDLQPGKEERCFRRETSLIAVRKEFDDLYDKIIDLKQRGYQAEGKEVDALCEIIYCSSRDYIAGYCHLAEYQSRIQKAVDKATPVLNAHRNYIITPIAVALVNLMIAVTAVATVGMSAAFSYALTGSVFFKKSTDSAVKKENIADAVKQVNYKK